LQLPRNRQSQLNCLLSRVRALRATPLQRFDRFQYQWSEADAPDPVSSIPILSLSLHRGTGALRAKRMIWLPPRRAGWKISLQWSRGSTRLHRNSGVGNERVLPIDAGRSALKTAYGTLSASIPLSTQRKSRGGNPCQ
jgi:hypothetical protein